MSNKKKNTRNITLNEKSCHLYMKWINVQKRLPKIYKARFHGYPHTRTVLVYVEGKFKGMDQTRFAEYIKGHGWNIHGLQGNFKVLWWAHIKNPLKSI